MLTTTSNKTKKCELVQNLQKSKEIKPLECPFISLFFKNEGEEIIMKGVVFLLRDLHLLRDFVLGN